jgi:hypothetical protein
MYVIGGYDPQSWFASDSTSTYNFTVPDALRTAFIFNLTTGHLRRQKLVADSEDLNCSHACGAFQTLNYAGYGPTFGGGHDLNVGFDVLANRESDTLSVGYEEAYTYGAGFVYYDDRGLLPLNSTRCGSACGFDTFTVGALETYVFTAQSAVPEPATAIMLITGLAVAIRGRRPCRNLTTRPSAS